MKLSIDNAPWTKGGVPKCWMEIETAFKEIRHWNVGTKETSISIWFVIQILSRIALFGVVVLKR